MWGCEISTEGWGPAPGNPEPAAAGFVRQRRPARQAAGRRRGRSQFSLRLDLDTGAADFLRTPMNSYFHDVPLAATRTTASTFTDSLSLPGTWATRSYHLSVCRLSTTRRCRATRRPCGFVNPLVDIVPGFLVGPNRLAVCNLHLLRLRFPSAFFGSRTTPRLRLGPRAPARHRQQRTPPSSDARAPLTPFASGGEKFTSPP